MLKVHDLTVDQSCIEFEPIIEMFVSTAVKAAIVTFEEVSWESGACVKIFVNVACRLLSLTLFYQG